MGKPMGKLVEKHGETMEKSMKNLCNIETKKMKNREKCRKKTMKNYGQLSKNEKTRQPTSFTWRNKGNYVGP